MWLDKSRHRFTGTHSYISKAEQSSSNKASFVEITRPQITPPQHGQPSSPSDCTRYNWLKAFGSLLHPRYYSSCLSQSIAAQRKPSREIADKPKYQWREVEEITHTQSDCSDDKTTMIKYSTETTQLLCLQIASLIEQIWLQLIQQITMPNRSQLAALIARCYNRPYTGQTDVKQFQSFARHAALTTDQQYPGYGTGSTLACDYTKHARFKTRWYVLEDTDGLARS